MGFTPNERSLNKERIHFYWKQKEISLNSPLQRWNDFDLVLASNKVAIKGRLHQLRKELIAQDRVRQLHDLEDGREFVLWACQLSLIDTCCSWISSNCISKLK